MPSSGDSTRRNCPRCHRRMSSFTVDHHSLCFKYKGSDCNTENRCNECLNWVVEMESYIKLCKSLANKSRNKKSGVSKAPSSPRPITPVVSSPVAPAFSLADVDCRALTAAEEEEGKGSLASLLPYWHPSIGS